MIAKLERALTYASQNIDQHTPLTNKTMIQQTRTIALKRTAA